MNAEQREDELARLLAAKTIEHTRLQEHFRGTLQAISQALLSCDLEVARAIIELAECGLEGEG